MRERGSVPPSQGGCWYCYNKDNLNDMEFSFEWDTNVHLECLKEALQDPNNEEAKIIAREFGLDYKTRGFEKVSLSEWLERNNGVFEEEYGMLIAPKRKTSKSAGYDFHMPHDLYLKPNMFAVIKTGYKSYMECDEVLEMYIRSSLAIKKNLIIKNLTGIIDADYHNNPDNEGHIMIALKNIGDTEIYLEQGEAFCQGIFKKYLLADGDDFDSGDDRIGGIGSTDSVVK